MRNTPRAARTPLARAAAVFAVLGDETRLRLVSRLCARGSMSLTQLAGGFDMTRQAVTKHLQVLEAAGLVRRKQEGRQSVWDVERKRLAETRRHFEAVSAGWDAALARLKDFVERDR